MIIVFCLYPILTSGSEVNYSKYASLPYSHTFIYIYTGNTSTRELLQRSHGPTTITGATLLPCRPYIPGCD